MKNIMTAFALSTALFATSSAFAAPDSRDILHNTNNCTYGGLDYSEGSVVDQAGVRKKCSGGKWVKANRGNSRDRFSREPAPRNSGVFVQ